MECFNNARKRLLMTRAKLKENSFDSLIWMVNVIPKIAGFDISREKVFSMIRFYKCLLIMRFNFNILLSSIGFVIFKKKLLRMIYFFACYFISGFDLDSLLSNIGNISYIHLIYTVPFWILHLFLLTYVYGVGSVVYQTRDAKVASDFIKSFVNVSLFVLIANNSYWFLTKRKLLQNIVKKAKENDSYVTRSGLFAEKHRRSLFMIKRILLIFYGCNLTNEFTVYLPKRIDLNKETFSMTLCVGMEPLTSFPNREICKTLLGIHEFTIVSVVLNYQTMMLLLVAHTALMYQLLSDEILMFNTELEDPSNYESVKNNLSVIISRHALILEITGDLKSLYNMPMGVNFGSNAVCMCFFFFLTWEEYLGFMPVVVYCFLVFFLYCFLCQRLTNAAEVFARAVYSCGWEKMNVKEQKAIYTMLLEAQKPIELLAADLIPVNMYTFGSTIQAIYKFTTVVKL